MIVLWVALGIFVYLLLGGVVLGWACCVDKSVDAASGDIIIAVVVFWPFVLAFLVAITIRNRWGPPK